MVNKALESLYIIVHMKLLMYMQWLLSLKSEYGQSYSVHYQHVWPLLTAIFDRHQRAHVVVYTQRDK